MSLSAFGQRPPFTSEDIWGGEQRPIHKYARTENRIVYIEEFFDRPANAVRSNLWSGFHRRTRAAAVDRRGVAGLVAAVVARRRADRVDFGPRRAAARPGAAAGCALRKSRCESDGAALAFGVVGGGRPDRDHGASGGERPRIPRGRRRRSSRVAAGGTGGAGVCCRSGRWSGAGRFREARAGCEGRAVLDAGRQIVIAVCGDAIAALPADGGAAKALTKDPGRYESPVVSPDGGRIAYLFREKKPQT